MSRWTVPTTSGGGSSTPTNLAPVATSGAYGDLTGRPNLAAVATSGAYADLGGTPAIPDTPDDIGAASIADLVHGLAPVMLTDAATIATNAALGNFFRVSIAGNRTLGAPTNPTDGQTVVWEVTASGGSRTLSFSTGTGGFSGSTRLPAAKSGHTFFVRAIYKTSITKWIIDTPEVFGERLYASTQAERDAYNTAFGYIGMQVVRTDLGGTTEWWDGTVWHSNASPAPVVLAGAAVNGNTSNTEYVWASATIPDPGYVYRIEVGGRFHAFVNAGTRVLMRARAGLSGTADLSLGEVSRQSGADNDVAGVFGTIATWQTSSSFSGAGRVAFTAARDLGTGNWDLPVNEGWAFYRVVPA